MSQVRGKTRGFCEAYFTYGEQNRSVLTKQLAKCRLRIGLRPSVGGNPVSPMYINLDSHIREYCCEYHTFIIAVLAKKPKDFKHLTPLEGLIFIGKNQIKVMDIDLTF